MKNKLKDKIFSNIEENHIEPKARWKFAARRLVFWVFAFLSVVLGSIGSSLLIFALANTRNVGGVPMVSVLWLIALVIFGAATYYNFHHTKKGYRYNFWIIFLCSILLSFVIGIGLYASRVSSQFDRAINENVSSYRGIENQLKNRWVDPAAGVLAGTVVRGDDVRFTLRDFNNREWIIDTSNLKTFEQEIIRNLPRVRVVGDESLDGDSLFKACAVLPWDPPRGQRISSFGDLDMIFEDRQTVRDQVVPLLEIVNEINFDELRTKVCGE